MKKFLIGAGSIGLLSAAPVIAYVTTHNTNREKHATSIDSYAFSTRLRDSAMNLANADSNPNDFIRQLDNNQDIFMTTQGMYNSVKKILIGRNLIQEYYTVYKSGDDTRVVFYYDKAENDNNEAPTKSSINLFYDHPKIKASLDNKYWGNDILIDSKEVGAVAIFTLDKDHNVVNVAAGVRHKEIKSEFDSVEEMLVFESDVDSKYLLRDFSKYAWIPKYGVACDLSADLPFKYLFNEDQQLIHASPLLTTNLLGFSPVKTYNGLLTWTPTGGQSIPVPQQEEQSTPGLMAVPVIDRSKLGIPILQPHLDTSVLGVPMLMPIPEAYNAPTLIKNK